VAPPTVESTYEHEVLAGVTGQLNAMESFLRGVRTGWVAALCVVVVASSGIEAQHRFHVLSDDVVGAISGLHIYTIRDTSTATCFTIFLLEPGARSPTQPPLPPELTSDQLEKMRVAGALKGALATREHRLDDLNARRTLMWIVEYEAARAQIENEYELDVRNLLPDVHPPAQIAPGWPTTSREELNAAVQQAIDAGDEAAARAAGRTLDDQVRELLARNPAPDEMAVSGPVPCAYPSH
jgi:hypothetical protein